MESPVSKFLVDGARSLLSDQLRELIHQPQSALYPDLPVYYGYGLLVQNFLTIGDDFYEVEVWEHGGNTTTHTSTFRILPEKRFAISILSNGLGDDFSASVATAIETLVELPAPSVAPTPPFNPDELDALTGTYAEPAEVGEIIVTRQGNTLHIEVPSLDALGIPYGAEMRARSTRVWVMTGPEGPMEVRFIDGPDGEAYMATRPFVAVRPVAGTSTAAAAAPLRTPSREAIRRAFTTRASWIP